MSPVQGNSPLGKVKEPYGNLDMSTCRLSSCNLECKKVHLLIILASEGEAAYREKEKEKDYSQGLFLIGIVWLHLWSQVRPQKVQGTHLDDSARSCFFSKF